MTAPTLDMALPSFSDLFDRHAVVPIRGCPGRFIIRDAGLSTVEALLRAPAVVVRCSTPEARDPVLVVRLAEGRILSFERPNGSYVHTLCDGDGFRRKLAQLGISLDAPG